MSRFETTEQLFEHLVKVDHKLAHELASGGGLRGILDLQSAEASHTTLDEKVVILRRLQSVGVRAEDAANAVIDIVKRHNYPEAAARQAVREGLMEVMDRAVFLSKEAPKKPRLGVAVFGTHAEDGHLLLGRRGKQPNLGRLVLPGGGVEWGETIEDTARRELKEETGAEIAFFDVHEHYTHEVIGESEHRVIIVVRAQLVPGELKAGSDLRDAAYYPRNNIPLNEVSPVVVPILRRFGWGLN